MPIWTPVVWLGLAGFYLVLAGDVSAVEGIASIVCASAGVMMSIGLSRVSRHHFAGRPPPRAILRPLAGLGLETFTVGRQLVAAIFVTKNRRGTHVRQAFDPGGDDPASAGRRAAVVLGLSLAPGSFVVGGENSDEMLLHALPRKTPSPDLVWPV